MRADIIGYARINYVCKSQSCMVSGWATEPRWLLVEDPFETNRNVAAVLRPESEALLFREFQRGAQLLSPPKRAAGARAHYNGSVRQSQSCMIYF